MKKKSTRRTPPSATKQKKASTAKRRASDETPTPDASRPTPAVLDRYSLYELCAQSPQRDARLLRAIHAFGGTDLQIGARARVSRSPLIFAEDFCGTAALSRAWIALFPHDTAIAADRDPVCIERAITDAGDRGVLDKITFALDDVRNVREKADIIAVQNFSICELHDRADLITYLKHARARIRKGGCFVCDIYDGADRFNTGILDDTIPGPDNTSIYYEWEQRDADPLTARVVNAMHFEVKHTARSKARPSKSNKMIAARSASSLPRNPDPETRNPTTMRLRDAFVYDWRLWSVPELRDALREAGFRETLVFPRTPDAIDSDGRVYAEPVTDPYDLGDAFNVYVVGR